MDKPIPKQEAKVQLLEGHSHIIEVYTVSLDMDELARTSITSIWYV